MQEGVFTKIAEIAREHNIANVIEGSNLDDDIISYMLSTMNYQAVFFNYIFNYKEPLSFSMTASFTRLRRFFTKQDILRRNFSIRLRAMT